MNKSKSIILASAFLCVMSSTTKANLSEILQKYCVPTSGNTCIGESYATYNGSSCECSACNMYYDKNTRSCKTCATGYYSDSKTATECIRASCGTGYYSEIEVGKSTCPSGYYKEILSSCK